jgi:hypothetical protein
MAPLLIPPPLVDSIEIVFTELDRVETERGSAERRFDPGKLVTASAASKSPGRELMANTRQIPKR